MFSVTLFIFPQKMDKNKDGVVTMEEFVIACQEVSATLYICYCLQFFCNTKVEM